MKNMTAAAAVMLTFLMFLPVVLGANPYRKFLKDASFCQEKDAVCKMSSGNYGCCPTADGVCCADGDHCCPSGFECDLSAKQCLQYGDPALYVLTEDMLDVAPIGSRAVRELTKGVEEAFTMQNSVSADTSNVCPNGIIQCPDNMTCCATKEPNTYSCCPENNAVCCSAGMYCCPEAYKCNNDKGTCVKSTLEIAAHSLEEMKKLETVICPDHSSQCPNRNTCCKLTDGNYACCPLRNAVCCSDNKHCCPHGYSCDVKDGTCTRTPLLYAQFSNKKPTVSLEIKQTQSLTKRITCPDDKTQCPNKDTCCLLSTDVYGCCPQPNATCCADKKHCCPHGYICDKPTSTCMKAGMEEQVVPLQELVIKTPTKICRDGGSCPNGDTCCLNGPSTYGCCPILNAVCCPDLKSCCPEGYKCDVESGTCIKGAVIKSLELIELVRSLSNDANVITCPGNEQTCPDGNTCCITVSGRYGCCPVADANCCSDHIHCCPIGFTCDVTAGTCTKSSLDCDKENCPNGTIIKADLIEHVKRIEDNIKHNEIVICPGGVQYCLNDETCCPNLSGGYSCCPDPNADCCSDGVHCCPSGYTCDSGSCINSSPNEKTDLIELVNHVEDNIKHEEIVFCPGSVQYCPNGETCCLDPSGEYGCCPEAYAVCCSDGIHCCPSGSYCVPYEGCRKYSLDVLDRIPFLVKSPTARRL